MIRRLRFRQFWEVPELSARSMELLALLPPAGTQARDGLRGIVEVDGWLRWESAYPAAIGPGQAEQTKRYGGWADGDGMTSLGVRAGRALYR
jgi:hypothetical protein